MVFNSRIQEIDRAGYELTRNFRYYQARVPNPKIRALKIDSDRMKETSEQAVAIMTRFLEFLPDSDEAEVSNVYDEV